MDSDHKEKKDDRKTEEKDEQVKKTDAELAQEHLEGWKRALADYRNLKQETERKSKEWMQAGANRVIEKLVPIYNNFRQAVEHIPPDQQELPWVVGIKYIKTNMEELFRDLGLEMIATVGERFDETLHEAVSEEDVEDEKQKDVIIKEVSVGFKKDGNVIIPAKVVVGK